MLLLPLAWNADAVLTAFEIVILANCNLETTIKKDLIIETMQQMAYD